IHLTSKVEFGKGLSASLSQTMGSFGLFNSAVSAGYSSKSFSSRTRLFRQFTQNNFEYKDISRPGTPETREDHARVEQRSVVQDLAWNLTESSQLKAAFWWQESNRQIQPVMGSRTRDVQTDEGLRAVLD